MKFVRNLIIAVSLSLLGGCMTPYKIPTITIKDAPYPTDTVSIEPDQILIQKNFGSIDNVNFVLLKVNSNYEPKKHKKFVKHALNDLGFKEIYSEEELVKKIIEKGLDSEVSSLTDLLSLKKLYDALGSFIVIEWDIDFVTSPRWKNSVTVIDPSVPEKILEIRGNQVIWNQIDSEMVYPTVNLFREIFSVESEL